MIGAVGVILLLGVFLFVFAANPRIEPSLAGTQTAIRQLNMTIEIQLEQTVAAQTVSGRFVTCDAGLLLGADESKRITEQMETSDIGGVEAFVSVGCDVEDEAQLLGNYQFTIPVTSADDETLGVRLADVLLALDANQEPSIEPYQIVASFTGASEQTLPPFLYIDAMAAISEGMTGSSLITELSG